MVNVTLPPPPPLGGMVGLQKQMFDTLFVNMLDYDIALFKTNMDHFFLLVVAIIIFFMQCGFAFLECGTVRMGNAVNILFKNVMDAFLGAVSYYGVGYAFAYGVPGNKFIGYNYFFGCGLDKSKYSFWFFQFSFAATASTIVSGAVAERMEMIAYIILSTFITAFVYPVISHWAWGGGWLAQEGFIDFAGSGVCHLCGASCALVSAILLGPRIGRFTDPNFGRAHSIPHIALGSFILFFGFLLFNGGSVGSISTPGNMYIMANAMVITILTGACAGVFTLIFYRNWSLALTVNGVLVGMVAACAGCDQYEPVCAPLLGFFASVSYICISWLMSHLHIDDPLDAVAVHGSGGIVGLIFVAFFGSKQGIVYYGSETENGFLLLKWQTIGALAIAGWSIGLSLLILIPLACVGKLRVKKTMESEYGMDEMKHHQAAYPEMMKAHRNYTRSQSRMASPTREEYVNAVIYEEEPLLGSVPVVVRVRSGSARGRSQPRRPSQNVEVAAPLVVPAINLSPRANRPVDVIPNRGSRPASPRQGVAVVGVGNPDMRMNSSMQRLPAYQNQLSPRAQRPGTAGNIPPVPIVIPPTPRISPRHDYDEADMVMAAGVVIPPTPAQSRRNSNAAPASRRNSLTPIAESPQPAAQSPEPQVVTAAPIHTTIGGTSVIVAPIIIHSPNGQQPQVTAALPQTIPVAQPQPSTPLVVPMPMGMGSTNPTPMAPPPAQQQHPFSAAPVMIPMQYQQAAGQPNIPSQRVAQPQPAPVVPVPVPVASKPAVRRSPVAQPRQQSNLITPVAPPTPAGSFGTTPANAAAKPKVKKLKHYFNGEADINDSVNLR